MRAQREDAPARAAPPNVELLRAEERLRVRDGLAYCLRVFAGVRVGLFVLGLVSVAIIPPHRTVSVPGWPAHPVEGLGWDNLFTAWDRFDALWFLRIAATGYQAFDGSAAFFPLYPLAIRALAWALGGHPLAAAFLISNGSFLGGLIVLYFLTSSELSEAAARRAVLYLALFPTSFFFFSPYSESLFFLLAVSAFWAARRDRWALAGMLGALAALTRNMGVLLVPALAVEAFHQRLERRAPLLPRFLSSGFVGLGTLAYLAYWWNRTGDALAPVSLEAHWERIAVAPWSALLQGTKMAFRYLGVQNGGYWLIDWLIVVAVLAAAAYGLPRFRPAYGVYVWLGLLAPLSFVFQQRPLMSMPRFVLPLFPVVWGLSEATGRHPRLHQVVVALGAAGLGLLTILYVNWYYIF